MSNRIALPRMQRMKVKEIACEGPACWCDARYYCPIIQLDFCSEECRQKVAESRALEAEHDRLAEIQSGGQV